jgi:REP element-mobilizing transposase RayT
LLEGGTYHLHNRGSNSQRVYRCDSDDRAFLKSLRDYLGVAPAGPDEAAGTRLLAYCLMPNHYHLLVQPLDDALSSRMQRLQISFTKALNAKYQRVGALIQGQFQAVAVETDEHLTQPTAYVHFNPVQAGLVRRPDDWEYSSRRKYLCARPNAAATRLGA